MEMGHPLLDAYLNTSPRFVGIYSTFNQGCEFFSHRMRMPLNCRDLVLDVIHKHFRKYGKHVLVDWVYYISDFRKQLRLAPLIVAESRDQYWYFEIIQCHDHHYLWGLRYAEVTLDYGWSQMEYSFDFLYKAFSLVLRSIVDNPQMPAHVQRDTGIYSITSVIKTLFGGYPFLRLHGVIQPTGMCWFIEQWFELLYDDDVVVFDDPNQNFPENNQLEHRGTVYRVACHDEYHFRVQASCNDYETIIRFLKVDPIPIPDAMDVEDMLERIPTKER
jgi:hypothetical protein